MSKTTLIGVLMIIVLVVGMGAGYLYVMQAKNQAMSPDTLAYQTLPAKSENYKKADQFNSQRQYAKAIEKYTAALSDTDSLSEEVFIKFLIAWATRDAGDNLKAIDLFKDIVANPRYASDLEEIKQGKAQAITAMVTIFYRTNDVAITDKIFSGKPYEDFRKKEDNGNISIAYRRLLEYASSFSTSPDLTAEVQIAWWYAREIYELKKKETISEAERQQTEDYAAIVKLKLAYVDQNSNDGAYYYERSRARTLPLLLRFKAIVVGMLTLAGDTSLGDPEKMFQEALLRPQNPWSSSQTKYSYAVFLASAYGEKRKGDIADLLSDIYGPPIGTELNWETFFLNQKMSATRMKKDTLLLATIDPQFKAFLINLGWEL